MRTFFAACLLAVFLAGAACSSSSEPAASDRQSQVDISPRTSGSSRHVALGFFICGRFLPDLPDNSARLISDDSGSLSFSAENNVASVQISNGSDVFREVTLADIGQFITRSEISRFTITDDSLQISRTRNLADLETYSEEAGCDGRPATLSVTRWNISRDGVNAAQNPQVSVTNLADISFAETAEAVTISLLPSGSGIPPLPFSTLEMLEINDVIILGNLPTAQDLGLVPVRTAPPPGGLEISENPTPCPPQTGPVIRVSRFSHLPGECLNRSLEYTALFETTMGDIVVRLDNRPYVTTNAFLVLARYLYYDGSALFRTEPSQGIIQGGAPNSNRVDDPGPGFIIPDETGRTFEYGAGKLLMARNANDNSANGQFIFGATENSARLEGSGNVVFGDVIEGLEILERILSLHVEDPSAASSEERFFLGGPVLPVILERIVISQSAPES